MRLNLTKTPSQLFSKRLTHIKHSQLIIKDLERLENVKKWNSKKDYLLQSYIINLVASWQVFIEELLEFGLNKILENNNSNSVVTKVFQSNFELNKKRFNTPNINNIDQIFKAVLTIDKITNNLTIPNMELKEIKDKVNSILIIRHKIAHTGKSGELLDLETNFDFMNHLMEVGKQLELKIIKELEKK